MMTRDQIITQGCVQWVIGVALIGCLFLGSSNLTASTFGDPKGHPTRTCGYVIRHLVEMMNQLMIARGSRLYQDTEKLSDHQNKWHELSGFSDRSCRNKRSSQQVLKTAAHVRSFHTRKVGLLIPTHGLDSYLSQSFDHGLKSACEEMAECDLDQILVRRLYNPYASGDLNRALGHLLYDDGVSVIIGGFHRTDHTVLNRIATLFSVPVFLMSPSAVTSQYSRHVFLHSPSQRLLLARILTYFRSYGITQVALVEPAESEGSTKQDLMSLAGDYGVQLAFYENYHSHYKSLVDVSQKLLKLAPGDRKAEWAQLVSQKTEESAQTGEPFSSEDIFLNPRFDYDALIIADNAKMVRHFVKIFRYLRLKKAIPLVGMHHWRAEEILDPWDPLLEGAHFVDFIGRYDHLPSFIRSHGSSDRSHNGYFIDPAMMAAVDLQLLGYRAMKEALQAMMTHRIKRSQLSEFIRSSLRLQFAQQSTAHLNPHEVYWPTHLFKLSRGQIYEYSQSLQKSPLAQHMMESR